MKEQWKDVKGYEGIYEISNLGRLKRISKECLRKGKTIYFEERIRNLSNDKAGYKVSRFSKDGKAITRKIHRIVAIAFIPNPHNLPEVNHKNEIKNDNRVENLEWCTSKYNANYGTRTKRCVANKDWVEIGIKKSHGKVKQYDMNGNFIKEHECMSFAAKELGISQSGLGYCCNRKNNFYKGYRWELIRKSGE